MLGGPWRVALIGKERNVLPINLRQLLKLHNIYPPLACLNLRHKRLWLADPATHFGLCQVSIQTSLFQPLEESFVAFLVL